MSNPKDGCTGTQVGATENNEPIISGEVVAKEAGNINRVTECTYENGPFKPKTIDEWTHEESKDTEGRVQGGVGVVSGGRVDLSSTTQSSNSIEETRLQKADDRDQCDLNLGGGIIPTVAEDSGSLGVHPLWASSVIGILRGLGFNLGHSDGRRALVENLLHAK